MSAFRRWQDWTEVIAGVALVAAPYAFSETSNSTALWTTGIIGVVMVLVGLATSSAEKAGGMEWLPALVGIAAFIAPWAADYTALTATAWASWVVGVVAVVAAGEVSFESHSPQRA